MELRHDLPPVPPSSEFARVVALPRRMERQEINGQLWEPTATVDLSLAFARAGSYSERWALKPVQERALREIAISRGGVVLAAAGAGKSLIAWMLPAVMEAQRALILVPAQLVGTMTRECARYLEHGIDVQTDRVIGVVSHHALSRPAGVGLLDELNPDLVIVDEAHAFARRASVRTRRLFKWLADHPDTRTVWMSGTLLRKSIMEVWQFYLFGLRERSPLPIRYPTVKSWAAAIDPPDAFHASAGPGVLASLPGAGLQDAVGKRLTETVGVVATRNDDGADMALNILERRIEMPPSLREVLDEVEETWELPNGAAFSDVLRFAAVRRQLAAGFYYAWAPPLPPAAWIDARRGLAAAFRAHRSWRGLDSPGLMIAALRKNPQAENIHPNVRAAWAAWVPWLNHAEPETEGHMVDPFLVDDAVTWGRESPGVIWCLSRFLAEQIARSGGFPCHLPGSDLVPDIAIDDEDGTRTIVASVSAFGTGKNLQAFDRALVIEPPASGKTWEQLLARHHRMGQRSDEVTFHVYQHAPIFRKALAAARAQAQFIERMHGDRQRLCYATTDLFASEDVESTLLTREW